jgi:hypothetical protein
MRRSLLLAVALLALAPAGARAATVSTSLYMECNNDPACAKYQAGTMEVQLTFRGEPGEANRVVIEPAGAGRVRVADTGAPLRPAPSCEADGPNAALCPIPRATYVELGDGDDTLAVSLGPKTYVSGGDGSDTIDGGPTDEQLDGGPGQDRVQGGSGDDELMGSVGDGGPTDLLDGGEGVDVVSYARRTLPVVASLAPGSSANVDRLIAVEGLVGGTGDDVLAGSTGGDLLSGDDGDDVLLGEDGDDRLIGGAGEDALSAGAGDDTLEVYDGAADRVGCGAGRDQALTAVDVDEFYVELAWRGADAADLLRRDCERTALRGFPGDADPFLVDPRVRLLGRRAVLRNPCATIDLRPCAGTLRLGRGRGRIARRFGSGSGWVVVRLPRAPRRLPVSVTVRTGDDRRGSAWTAEARTPVG